MKQFTHILTSLGPLHLVPNDGLLADALPHEEPAQDFRGHQRVHPGLLQQMGGPYNTAIQMCRESL